MVRDVGKDAILEADLRHVWHPLTQHAALRERPPKLIVRGEGCRVIDAEGREYLDAMSGLWCVNVGYGRREVAEAVYEQMTKLAYYPHTQANEPAALLAEELAELTQGALSRVYFVNSGTEAVETALKLARQYQRQTRPGESRYKFITRYYSYHGASFWTLGAGGVVERKAGFEPLHGPFVHVPPAYCYRCPFGLSYPACGLACAKYVEYAIQAEGPESVAAVLMEPIQSAVGVLVPPPEYLSEVARICRNYGVLLVFDEVINGFGRTGQWFAFQHYGVVPDLVAVAKGLTSGYAPMGAVLATDTVFQGFWGHPSERRHAEVVNTWGGHAAAAAAARKNLEILRNESLPERAAEIGRRLLERLEELLTIPIVGDIRGKGMLIGVELVEDKATRAPLAGVRVQRAVEECLARGVIVGRSVGGISGLGNTITLAPPLVLKWEEAEKIARTLREVLLRV